MNNEINPVVEVLWNKAMALAIENAELKSINKTSSIEVFNLLQMQQKYEIDISTNISGTWTASQHNNTSKQVTGCDTPTEALNKWLGEYVVTL